LTAELNRDWKFCGNWRNKPSQSNTPRQTDIAKSHYIGRWSEVSVQFP
jgi:hypothetical protein